MTVEIPNHGALSKRPVGIAERCKELATLVTQHTEDNRNRVYPTAIDQLQFTRYNTVSTALHDVYEPLLAIIVQGQKKVLLGEETYQYGATQYLVASVDLPVSCFVVEATPDKPYLGLMLNLDLMQLCDLVAQMGLGSAKKENSVRGVSVSNADAELVECTLRLTKLLDTPQHIPILAPIMVIKATFLLAFIALSFTVA